MSEFVFPPQEIPSVAVTGGGRFPVRRIFCVGKNYDDHVREMGDDPKSMPPVFFTKPADAVHPGGDMSFPLATDNLHYEGELVVALKSGGIDLSVENAEACIYGYAAGCDLTRRDLQAAAKEKRGPWDTAKTLDYGAVLGEIAPVSQTGILSNANLQLSVNGEIRQSGNIANMIWTTAEIIAKLSTLFELKAGDLIYTGTPEGVGPLKVGDTCEVKIEGLDLLRFTMTDRTT